jgi:hypothetical protein
MNLEPDHTRIGAEQNPLGQRSYAKQQLAAHFHAESNGSPSELQPSSLFAMMSARIQTLGSILGEANQELTMVGDRVFGGFPESGSAGAKSQPQAAGHAGSVIEALDILLGAAGDIAQRVRALNSKL